MSELNVITACFPCGEKSAVTEKRWQWSYGQILKFQGIPDLPDVFNVHFSGQPSAGTAKSWPAQNAQVEIPNEYLETGGPVYAWIFLHEGEEDGETVYDITIPVKRRPQPTDEPITPTQQSAIDTAIAILQSSAATASEQAEIATEAAETATSAVDAVTEAAREAAQSALSASNAATNAQTAQRAAAQSATDAETARRTAGDFAEAANASAIRAEDSANDATESAARAATADENAQAAKTAAEASASAAAQSATQASGSASQAALSASNAASSATSAQTSATNAEQSKTDAETARTGAETAQGKAEEAQGKAEEAEATAEWYAERVERFLPTDTASGSIASFSDGADGAPMESVTVTMTPQQDLHGQDSPYPAGGRVNKCLLDAETITKPSWYTGGWLGTSLNSNNGITQTRGYQQGSAGGFVVSGLSAGDWTISLDFDTAQARVYCGVYYTTDGTDINTLKEPQSQMNSSGSRAYLTVSIPQNQGVIFRPTYLSMTTAYDLNNIQVESGSSATDFAPYSNICPITGHDSGTVWGTGGNIFDPTKYVAGSAANPMSLEGDTYTMTWGNGGISFRTKGVQTFPAGTYTISATGSNVAGVKFYIYDAETDALITGISTFTASVPFYIGVGGDYRNPGTAVFTIQLETGSTASPYSPYTGASYHSDFPSTVYGGEWGVTEGEIDSRYGMVDLGTLDWNYSTSGVFYTRSLNGANSNASTSVYYCTQYKFMGTATGNDNAHDKGNCTCSVYTGADARVYIRDDAYTDAPTFKSAMSGVMLCYPLVTPSEIPTTPHTIPTLLGDNNVWSDAGDIDVTYRADVGLYIDKRISKAISALS